MKLKAAAIMGIILLALIPVYLLHKYLQQKIRPRESGRRFLVWILAGFAMIFVFTFLVVFIIKVLFPGA